jgi:hypothetical protein
VALAVVYVVATDGSAPEFDTVTTLAPAKERPPPAPINSDDPWLTQLNSDVDGE